MGADQRQRLVQALRKAAADWAEIESLDGYQTRVLVDAEGLQIEIPGTVSKFFRVDVKEEGYASRSSHHDVRL